MSKTSKRWYSVSGRVVGSKYLGRFLASSADEAVDMALQSDEAWVSLCHQCSCECEDPQMEDAYAEPEDE